MTINQVSGVRADISEMLSKIREVSNKSKVFAEPNTIGSTSNVKPFNDVFAIAKNAISNVNQVQLNSEQLKNAYITGDKNVSMAQVVVASQKSKLAFEGLVTVRNKILEAYKDIMNMPV